MINEKLDTLINEFLIILEEAYLENNINPIKDIVKQHQSYLNQSGNNNLNKEYLSQTLLSSVKIGYLDAIDYLLTSPDLSEHPDVSKMESPLRIASGKGDLDIFKYFSERFEQYYPNERFDIAHFTLLGEASDNGQLNIVRFIMEHPNVKESSGFNRFESHSLQFAFLKGHLDIVQFFLPKDTTQKVEDNFFYNALLGEHMDIVKYCIFDLNIPFSEHLEEVFMLYSDAKTNQAREFFKIRELNQELEKELSSVTINKKKVKL